MAALGVDELFVIPFTSQIASMDRHAFLRWLIKTFNPQDIIVGYNYSFGYNGLGDGIYLTEKSYEYRYQMHIISPVLWDGEAVSSTRIRECIEQGDVKEARAMLMKPYSLTGVVEHGKRVGRTLGFPTANIPFPTGKVLPKFGVYAARLYSCGIHYYSVVNVGYHPTLPEGLPSIEAFVLQGSVDLYGKRIQVQFYSFLRAETVFNSLDALKAQIALDAIRARNLFRV
jgi:riboflavin kinase/FMN adenylyltransferase